MRKPFGKNMPGSDQLPSGDLKSFKGGNVQAGIPLMLTGEEVTDQIPPSVPVEYLIGNQKLTLSFTRINTENVVRFVLQELDTGAEAVVKVQILG